MSNAVASPESSPSPSVATQEAVPKPLASVLERQKPAGRVEQQVATLIHEGGDADQILNDIAESAGPKPETNQLHDLPSINVEGRRLASLIYTPEGQEVVSETQQLCSEVVDIQAESSKPRLSKSQIQDTVINGGNLNAELLARWQKRKESRTQELSRGAHMTSTEQIAYLKLVLGHDPSPTKDPAEIQLRTSLLEEFDKTRRDVGKATRYKESEGLLLQNRPTMFSEGALRFYGIPTMNAQEAFARGWKEVKKNSPRKINTEAVPDVQADSPNNPEAKPITESITTTALDGFLHEGVSFSAYDEIKADFVRFRGQVGEGLFLGTNHQSTDAEIAFVDVFSEDITRQGIKTAYIEQGGLTAQDNLDKWLEENRYLVGERNNSEKGELTHLTQSLTEKGIKVVNMDLAHNPSALSFAIEKFGLERTVRALNWDLGREAESLDFNGPSLDRNKIPEIITRLLTEAGGNIDQQQIAGMIQGRGIRDGDGFSDGEREDYMITVIKDKKAAVAAHSAHTSVLVSRINGNQQVENLKFQTDFDKMRRVMAETNSSSNENSYSQAA